MPVIVMASSKGGVGKTTCAILLAAGFARMGREVTCFDCDPNQSLTRWADRSLPSGVTHAGHPGANEIVPAIRQADGDGRIVIVDLEGSHHGQFPERLPWPTSSSSRCSQLRSMRKWLRGDWPCA